MELTIYQVDAFASKVFEGNPAAVVLLDAWLGDEVLQRIAEENNLSETVYFVSDGERYHIRWFTPVTEVKLCGHATLAAAYIIFKHIEPEKSVIEFDSLSGVLAVTRQDGRLTMDFPVTTYELCDTPDYMTEALGIEPLEVYKSDDYMVVCENEQAVALLQPDFALLSKLDCRGVIVTAPGKHKDFVSRFFAPRYGINEDPVTGSAHCMLSPYWANVLSKKELSARQISKRGGDLLCRLENGRVFISGTAVTYLEGKFCSE